MVKQSAEQQIQKQLKLPKEVKIVEITSHEQITGFHMWYYENKVYAPRYNNAYRDWRSIQWIHSIDMFPIKKLEVKENVINMKLYDKPEKYVAILRPTKKIKDEVLKNLLLKQGRCFTFEFC